MSRPRLGTTAGWKVHYKLHRWFIWTSWTNRRWGQHRTAGCPIFEANKPYVLEGWWMAWSTSNIAFSQCTMQPRFWGSMWLPSQLP